MIIIRTKPCGYTWGEEVCFCGPVSKHGNPPLIVCTRYTDEYARKNITPHHVYAICPKCIEKLPIMRGKWDTAFIPEHVPEEINAKILHCIQLINGGVL